MFSSNVGFYFCCVLSRFIEPPHAQKLYIIYVFEYMFTVY